MGYYRLALLCFACSLTASACLPEGQTDIVPSRSYTCSGIRCINDVIGRETHSSDDEAESGACHVEQLGRCIDGCLTTFPVKDIPGCYVAYGCRTWSRVEQGSACQTTVDCEPGSIDGAPANTLGCVEGRCVDLGVEKWGSASPAAVVCEGKPWYGAHPSCPGTACLSRTYLDDERFCSTGKCLEHSDCPSGWHCRCDEQIKSEGIKAYRWCVPDEPADAGSPADAGEEPDAGEAPDGGEPSDAGESPDGGEADDAGEGPDAGGSR